MIQDRLRSGEKAAELVIVAAGEFWMGCERGRRCNRSIMPGHRVRIDYPFAIMKYPVTFEEYDVFVAAHSAEESAAYAGSLTRLPIRSPGFRGDSRGQFPVVGVSWEEAQRYAQWLSAQTGESYRLPSEAEWEYAARAGTGTAYPWGDELGEGNANCHNCGTPWDVPKAGAPHDPHRKSGTSPVGSFAPNPWGLYDMHGNVSEWVQDCWHENYQGAPADGSAWESADGFACRDRVGRNGTAHPYSLTSTFRWGRNEMSYRSDRHGFRLVREISPRVSERFRHRP